MDELPELLAVPPPKLITGTWRETSRCAGSLSSVTMRGVDMICASEEEFRNEITAFTPSALRKPVNEINREAVLAPTPPLPWIRFSTVSAVDPPVVWVEPLGADMAEEAT